MPDNSPKALRSAITALATELHSLKSEIARTAGDVHKLLRDAPWKHEPHTNSPQDESDQNGKSTPGQAALTDSGTDDGPNQPKAAGVYRKPWWIRMWAWRPWSRILAVLAGAATIGYAIITWRQWNDLRSNFQTDQRAWVGVEGVINSGVTVSEDILKFQVIRLSVRNTGKTPAMMLSYTCCFIETRLWSDPIPDFDELVSAGKTQQMVTSDAIQALVKRFPGSKANIRDQRKALSQINGDKYTVLAPSVAQTTDITPANMNINIRMKDPAIPGDIGRPMTVYILGNLSYSDIFPNTERHITKFCIFRASGNEFTFCPRGNSMD